MESKEAIFVISGGFKRDEVGKWMSSDFTKSDCGPVGSNIRMLAGWYLYKENPRIIIASGGRGECEGLLPHNLTLSAILKRELVEQGVLEEHIIEENRGNNTYQQLVALAHIIKQYKFKTVLIVSNTHHLPRIEAMLQYKQELSEIKKVVKTISADQIVVANNASWKAVIEEAYQREPTLSTIKKEIKGTKQIKNGTYKFK